MDSHCLVKYRIGCPRIMSSYNDQSNFPINTYVFWNGVFVVGGSLYGPLFSLHRLSSHYVTNVISLQELVVFMLFVICAFISL